jgi:hypothetical protein
MVAGNGDSLVLVASKSEMPRLKRVWGTGGWLPPEDREALDWLTLLRLMGWGVRIEWCTSLCPDVRIPAGSRWIILACDPDCIDEELVALLASRLEVEPILVVSRAGAGNGAFAQLAGVVQRPEQMVGRSLRWIGPGPERNWGCRNTLEASVLNVSEKTSTLATLDGSPIIVARQVGRGIVVTLGFHPSVARDTDGGATALLIHLLIWGSLAPVAWLDLEGSLVLRMDDPGGAQNVYNRSWYYPKLRESEWQKISANLKKRNGRLSVGYTIGWVDDGDNTRGLLKVAGRVPNRIPGRVYPSPLVTYLDLNGHQPGTYHDYESEFRGIQILRKAGLGDVELHGYTHMHPNSTLWAKAPDRYETTSWYREFGSHTMAAIASRPLTEHPLALGISAFQQYFQVHPTTMINPGDEWTNEVVEFALNLGIQFVSSYYLALRNKNRFCWAQHVCAPYLDEPDSAWFDAGLPVVGYFHDYDLAHKGIDWMSKWLDRWQESGAQKFMDFRELAAAVGRTFFVEDHNGEICLVVKQEGAPQLVRPLRVMVRIPGEKMPSRVSVVFDNREKPISINVERLDHGQGLVTLPVIV